MRERAIRLFLMISLLFVLACANSPASPDPARHEAPPPTPEEEEARSGRSAKPKEDLGSSRATPANGDGGGDALNLI